MSFRKAPKSVPLRFLDSIICGRLPRLSDSVDILCSFWNICTSLFHAPKRTRFPAYPLFAHFFFSYLLSEAHPYFICGCQRKTTRLFGSVRQMFHETSAACTLSHCKFSTHLPPVLDCVSTMSISSTASRTTDCEKSNNQAMRHLRLPHAVCECW